MYINVRGCCLCLDSDSLEYGAGEGGPVQAQGAPDLQEGRGDHPKGEGPHRGDHQQDVHPGVDVVIPPVVCDQHISGENMKMKKMKCLNV